MRAFDVLLALHRLDMRQGKNYLEAPEKNDLELKVIEGKLKRNHWYWCDFISSRCSANLRLSSPLAVGIFNTFMK